MKIFIIENNNKNLTMLEETIAKVSCNILLYKLSSSVHCSPDQLSGMDLIIVNHTVAKSNDFHAIYEKNDKLKLVPIIVYGEQTILNPIFQEHVCLSNIFNTPKEMSKLKNYVEIIYKKSASCDPADFIDFKFYRRKISINKSTIVYIETSLNKIKLVTQFEELEVAYFRLCDYKSMFGNDFIRCHRSYIVNPAFIHLINFTENYLKLINNFGEIPIGEKYRSEIDLQHEFIS